MLQLLRSSLVNNRTQSVVCNDLGMTAYALYSVPKSDLKTKDRADLLEAFLGALYVDKVIVWRITYDLVKQFIYDLVKISYTCLIFVLFLNTVSRVFELCNIIIHFKIIGH